jgi:hypothetical protein
MKKFMFFTAVLMAISIFKAGSQANDLKTENDKIKFADKQFEVSMSHKANAGQTQNARMSGAPIDNCDLYKGVKKIAVLGLTVAFTSREGSGSRDEKSYGGIPVEQFDELAENILKSVYSSFEAKGFSVIKLEDVVKTSSYAKIDFGTTDENKRYSSDSWVCTPANSKWVEPDNVNSIKSGISLVHKDTLKARAFIRNKPFQDVAAEAGADAGINLVVRYFVSGGEIVMGWGPLKRGLVIDMIPSHGDPRVIWSATLKADLETGVGIGKFDKKSGITQKSWKYNLKPSIPGLTSVASAVLESAALKLKADQQCNK